MLKKVIIAFLVAFVLGGVVHLSIISKEPGNSMDPDSLSLVSLGFLSFWLIHRKNKRHKL